ncbi:MAG: galactokinase, partial [Chitinophagaceae bacterium]|nr:galactokinase [Chitinophagaceae bacterium]
VEQIVKRNSNPAGFNLVLSADIPVGAGLSSSAAIECAAGYALDQLFNLGLSRFDIARYGQLAEHFAGLQCGIMDEFASVFGKKDHALKLDCRSLEFEEVPLELAGYKILLLNTNVKHSLASSAYNTRRDECIAGVTTVKTHHPEVNSLRDVTIEMLDRYVKDPVVYKRCRFVIEENERVHKAVDHMKRGDIAGLGEQMLLSHAGLSSDYEVSCPELDWLVDAVKDNDAVAGARMMGGGFGGCTINIVKENAIQKLVDGIMTGYEKKFDKSLSVYEANTSEGTTLF